VKRGFPENLTPFVIAKKALRIVATNYLAAPGAGPPFFFVAYKMSYTELLNVIEIINHIQTILSSIALIQTIQRVTMKAVAAETVLNLAFRHPLTVLNFASTKKGDIRAGSSWQSDIGY